LAFGTQLTASSVAADNLSTGYYALGFRYPETGDVAVLGNDDVFLNTRRFLGNYEVADKLIPDNALVTKFETNSGYYGFSTWIFYGSDDYWINDTDTKTREMFRFIGTDEFDGARLTAGDTIDLFVWDFNHETYKDAPGFELAGAATLAAGGVALLAAILM
jgi:hypothetical protein